MALVAEQQSRSSTRRELARRCVTRSASSVPAFGHVPAPPVAPARTSVHVFEAGDGVGGTWYWNRYPGARFDSSWTYASPSPTSCCRNGTGASISRPSPRRCATATTSPTNSTCGGTSRSTAESCRRHTTRTPTSGSSHSRTAGVSARASSSRDRPLSAPPCRPSRA